MKRSSLFAEPDECASNPCQNDAQCIDKNLDVTCVCKPGFNGKYCESGNSDGYL